MKRSRRIIDTVNLFENTEFEFHTDTSYAADYHDLPWDELHSMQTSTGKMFSFPSSCCLWRISNSEIHLKPIFDILLRGKPNLHLTVESQNQPSAYFVLMNKYPSRICWSDGRKERNRSRIETNPDRASSDDPNRASSDDPQTIYFHDFSFAFSLLSGVRHHSTSFDFFRMGIGFCQPLHFGQLFAILDLAIEQTQSLTITGVGFVPHRRFALVGSNSRVSIWDTKQITSECFYFNSVVNIGGDADVEFAISMQFDFKYVQMFPLLRNMTFLNGYNGHYSAEQTDDDLSDVYKFNAYKSTQRAQGLNTDILNIIGQLMFSTDRLSNLIEYWCERYC